ncbi:hypothetical protein NW752_006736 [Fusarium irregulare]|uniref:RING-type domain-containing protein n=1 Tax=Fusarium irregulare TaxID=2494466 RepID=A0A9W8U9K4_9HYPO|nr:hypothetical protein NW766_005616 [Fusarium irregulare]KAJ4015813.1 hypothetical protein NW752_006736 [Fusarium irregulare]
MATVAVMEALKESGMQHTAQYQLNYLDEFEAANTDGDESIPQHIVELRLIRSYLLDVASGTVVWDAEEVARRVKLGTEGSTSDHALAATVGTASSPSAATFVACGPLTKSPEKERGNAKNTPTTHTAKANTTDFGERVANTKPKLSKVTSDAMSFLRSAPQSASPEGVAGVSSPTELAVVPSSETLEEEDLISFDPAPEVTPSKNEPGDVSSIRSSKNVLLEIDDQVKTEPPQWHIVLGRYPTLSLTSVKKEEVKCFVCHKASTEPLTTCQCSHQYCPDCLCNLVKTSVLGAAVFPPTCCGQLVPVNINSAVFDLATLRDFLTKKFENDHEINVGSPQDQELDGELTQAPDQVSLALEEAKQGMCYLCHRVNEKDAFCPDCCYRCNSSRTQCKCPWWAEREKREAAKKVVAESSFNPQAQDFNPTVNKESGQESAGRVLHRPRNSVLLEPAD